jgi:predicted DNA-binding transcriptional regulator AlpA
MDAVNVDDLVRAHEVVQRLGVARPQVVHEWRQRHADFPQPVANLKTALIWDWRDVRDWAGATRRMA